MEVSYRTAPDSLNEMLSGKLDYGMHDPVFSLAQQREGRLRILAVSTGQRLEALPDQPTMAELGIPMDLTGWWAAMVPAGTPKPVVDKIHQWFVQMVSSDETKKFLNSFGGDPVHQLARTGTGAARTRREGLGRLRAPRQDRTDVGIVRRTHVDITQKTTHPVGRRARAGGLGGVRVAQAQDYPSQDIRMIVGFPAGSGADIFVRYFAEKLRPIAGRTIIVENKPGANSNVATEFVARSKPDGHVLYPFAGTTVAASMHLFKNPPVDVGKALKVAATTSNLAFMLVVDAKSPYKTVAELTAAMKQKGDKASYATAANPGPDHGRDLPEHGRPECRGGAVSQRAGLAQRDAERPDRLRPARSDLRAGASARGPVAHPRGLDAEAAAVPAGPSDHDRVRHSDGPQPLVGRDGADRDAKADRRQDQSVVRTDRRAARRPGSSSPMRAPTP